MSHLKSLLSLAALSVCLSFFTKEACAQDRSEAVVIKLHQFSPEKNMQVYEKFKNDQRMVVLNSCDALGIVVLGTKESIRMESAEMRAYSDTRLQELFSAEEFELRTNQSPFEVAMACREEMQRQVSEQE